MPIDGSEYSFGTIEILRKNYPAAEQHLLEAFELDSTQAYTAQMTGYLYKEWGKFHQARTFSQKAIALDSSFANYNLMASVLVTGDIDIEEGKRLAQKALQSKPHDFHYTSETYPYLALPEHTLGLAAFKKGEFQKAVDWLQQAAEQLPERQQIQENLRLARQKLSKTAAK